MRLKNTLLAALIATSIGSTYAQIETHELGLDGSFSISTFGGNYNLGLKYGLTTSENVVFGPSFRVQRFWWKNLGGQQGAFNNIGGGAFFHYRYANYVFGGVEFEMIRTQLVNNINGVGKQWIPTLFIGGGFSRKFENNLRLNAGIFYDVIDNLNSPFRSGYTLKSTDAMGNQRLIPILYRIGIFIPIVGK